MNTIDISPDDFAAMFNAADLPDDKYERLTAVLKRAARFADYFADTDDGGACNFDSPTLDFKECHMNKAKAIQAIENAGLRCFDWRLYNNVQLVICGFQRGQADCHSTMAEVFHDFMKAYGYPANMYYQMD